MKYQSLHDQFLDLDSVLKKKRESLSRRNTEVALIDRQLKESKNKRFLLNKKLVDMQEALTLLKGGFRKKDAMQSRLKNKKKELEIKVQKLTEEISGYSKDIATLKNQTDINKQKELVLKKKKSRLSEDISRFLSETSIERDEFEKKAQDLNTAFIASLIERASAKSRLDIAQKESEEILAAIDVCKTRIEQAFEIKKLKEAVLEQETLQQSLGIRYAELQIELLNKREQIDSIDSLIEVQKKKISSISDSKLTNIEAALSELNEARGVSLDHAQELDGILEIVLENSVLAENHDMIWQRLESLESVLMEMTG
ncbi:MAG: hypothetical protein HQK61_11505 [Desulfamplus sp.]|nr:hypothetical protein [Desulfamplus sp.]